MDSLLKQTQPVRYVLQLYAVSAAFVRVYPQEVGQLTA